MSHADGTSVDLHWTLTFDLSTKEQMDLIWEGCRSSGENRALPGSRLSHEMTLIHFATHFQHHDYQEFKPLLDFHTAARVLGEKVIASDLICRAERLRLLPAVRMAARLCKLHFSSSGLIDTLTTPKSTARERLACRFLTADRLLRAENYSRRSDWLSRFFFSATPELSLRSLRKLLMPRPGELEILFARPFDVLMYPKYYGRRLQQALTATKQAF